MLCIEERLSDLAFELGQADLFKHTKRDLLDDDRLNLEKLKCLFSETEYFCPKDYAERVVSVLWVFNRDPGAAGSLQEISNFLLLPRYEYLEHVRGSHTLVEHLKIDAQRDIDWVAPILSAIPPSAFPRIFDLIVSILPRVARHAPSGGLSEDLEVFSRFIGFAVRSQQSR